MKSWIGGIIGRLGDQLVPTRTVIQNEQLSNHLIRLFEHLQINCVLDVGANQGQYGSFLRKIGFEHTIISFEPAQANFGVLESLAHKDPNWQAHHLALGDRAGTMSLNLTSDSLFNSFLTPNDFITEQGLKILAQEEVKVKRIDDIFEACVAPIQNPRVYLKMDTQGYDLQVLSAALESVSRILALQSEVSLLPLYDGMPDYLETLQVLNQIGFDMTGIFPIARDNALRIIEFDCVLIQRDAAGPPRSIHIA